MRKLLMICSSQVSIPPKKSGANEKIAFEIAKFVSNKFDTYVVNNDVFSYSGINYLTIKSKIRRNKLLAILEDVKFGFKCLPNINRLKPDIVHIHTLFTGLPIVLFSFLSRKTKIVYTSHNPSWTVPDNEIGFANIFFDHLESFIMRKAFVVTTVSNSMKDGILKKALLKPKRIETIYNFTYPKVFSPKLGKSWKHDRRITGDIILFVGKLTETKGVRYLMEAIPSVLKEFPQAKFILAGSLEHDQDLKNNPWLSFVKHLGVEKNVIFLGSVKNEMLPSIYSSADIFVLPTLREGMPLVVLEAMSSGLPIVATNVSGIPEIANRKNCIFIKRKDKDSISNAIKTILSNKKRAKAMGVNSVKMSLNFSVDKSLKQYNDLYEDMYKP